MNFFRRVLGRKQTSPEVSSAASRVLRWMNDNLDDDTAALVVPRHIAIDIVKVAASAMSQDETKGQ